MFPARFTTPPPKGCDMTDDKKNKMLNKGDKEAKKVKVEQLKGVAGGRGGVWFDRSGSTGLAPQGVDRDYNDVSLVWFV